MPRATRDSKSEFQRLPVSVFFLSVFWMTPCYYLRRIGCWPSAPPCSSPTAFSSPTLALLHPCSGVTVPVHCHLLPRPLSAVSARTSSWWTHVEMGLPDPILGVPEAFQRDNSKKMNLEVGAYWVTTLCASQCPEGRGPDCSKICGQEYLHVMRLAEFCKAAEELVPGKTKQVLKSST